VGVDKHPALRLTYALSLLSGTGGEADYALGHRVLRDVLKDEHAPDKLKACPPLLLATARGWGAEKRRTSSLPKLSTR